MILTPEEQGRGAKLPANRHAEIVAYCRTSLLAGARQKDIMSELGASRSRVSRWCFEALKDDALIDANGLLKIRGKTESQIIWGRIKVKNADECWPWRGFVKPNGYGSINISGKTRQAHRAVYECFVGDIPNGMVIDHRCNRRDCVNPAHLQAVHPSINLSLAKVRSLAAKP